MNKENSLSIKVECYAGYKGEETPRNIWFDKRKVTVINILDRWLSPGHRYFKFLGDDDALYIIRHDTETHEWAMTFFKQINDPTGVFMKNA